VTHGTHFEFSVSYSAGIGFQARQHKKVTKCLIFLLDTPRGEHKMDLHVVSGSLFVALTNSNRCSMMQSLF